MGKKPIDKLKKSASNFSKEFGKARKGTVDHETMLKLIGAIVSDNREFFNDATALNEDVRDLVDYVAKYRGEAKIPDEALDIVGDHAAQIVKRLQRDF